MSDLINREALIKAFESHGLEWRYLKTLNPILEEVDKQPFVIEKPKERMAKATRNPQGFFYHCDCGYALCCEKNDINYCPNCGARLEWE